MGGASDYIIHRDNFSPIYGGNADYIKKGIHIDQNNLVIDSGNKRTHVIFKKLDYSSIIKIENIDKMFDLQKLAFFEMTPYVEKVLNQIKNEKSLSNNYNEKCFLIRIDFDSDEPLISLMSIKTLSLLISHIDDIEKKVINIDLTDANQQLTKSEGKSKSLIFLSIGGVFMASILSLILIWMSKM
jgi:hypothetical protein